ncbi:MULTISPECIES: DUF1467 family protein [Paracoccus]|jgi:predicted secreted protein|uniref:DUF1467 family protein n=1 Tax=Paracoccus litorisediminis TaxID=2006130 RepID=A0A844HI79_9RHOB|nr:MULTISPECIES: DUF1467 family protein [Paracoccus]MBD9525713.1 DUF1467 family protein [Paracoccus sp. PAR01]MTH58164.1 DUF1467 family protein [Paracoccus litorisediminis]
MNLTGGIVLYAVLWFLVLFVLLPIGQQSQADVGRVTPGTPAGAPHEPKLKKKMIWATLIAALIWAGIAWVILGGVITRSDIEGWTS